MDQDAYTAFAGQRLLAQGNLLEVAMAAWSAQGQDHLLVFDDATGRTVDLDLRGTQPEVAERLGGQTPAKAARGRPKLGVTAREVTLLPRQWDWLATQPGGASAALRRLVDQARRENVNADLARQALKAAHRVMTTLAGDLPDFEESTRAFYARDYGRFREISSRWPSDVASYVQVLVARVEQAQAGT